MSTSQTTQEGPSGQEATEPGDAPGALSASQKKRLKKKAAAAKAAADEGAGIGAPATPGGEAPTPSMEPAGEADAGKDSGDEEEGAGEAGEGEAAKKKKKKKCECCPQPLLASWLAGGRLCTPVASLIAHKMPSFALACSQEEEGGRGVSSQWRRQRLCRRQQGCARSHPADRASLCASQAALPQRHIS